MIGYVFLLALFLNKAYQFISSLVFAIHDIRYIDIYMLCLDIFKLTILPFSTHKLIFEISVKSANPPSSFTSTTAVALGSTHPTEAASKVSMATPSLSKLAAHSAEIKQLNN